MEEWKNIKNSTKVCKGKLNKTHNYIWKYKDAQ